MTNYGLPLRFKAVEIATGKEVSTSKLILDPTDGQWHACYGGDTIRFDEEWVSDIKLFQSTGYKDANGTEIFFCDSVAISKKAEKTGLVYTVKMILGSIVCSTAEPVNYFDKVFSLNDWLSEVKVIGNGYTLTAELERRAREVRA